MMIFQNRSDAGRILGQSLLDVPEARYAVVLGLPRGGVPVAFEVAHKLHLPLDIFLVRKLGVPGEEELAMGAVASGGIVVTDPHVVRAFAISSGIMEAAVARERQEMERREKLYRVGIPRVPIENRTVILVDDGIATGSSMKAAILALRTHAHAIIVAVPVCSRSSRMEIAPEVDRFVCLECPDRFYAVGEFYREFGQTSDEEVTALLRRSLPERETSHLIPNSERGES
jgi:putative phosphoribosyl transferase